MADFGGVLAFDLDADKDRTWAFIDALELFTTTASLGSTESLVCPVKLYLGSDLTAEEHARAQIKESTVRFAVGIEHVDDLIDDIDQAMARRSAEPSRHAALFVPQRCERVDARGAVCR